MISEREQHQLFKRKSALLKLFLSFAVVQTHALNTDIYSLADMSGGLAAFVLGLERYWLTASGLVIPAFYFLSGFSFFSDYSYAKTLSKWKKRVFTLLIPWLCWNTIMWLFYIIAEKIPFVSAHINSGLGYGLSFRSWFVDALLNSADGPMWFMLNLMFAVILSPALYTLIKNRYVGIFALLCGLAAVYFTNADRYSLLVSTLFFAEAGYYAIHLRPFVLRRFPLSARLCSTVLLVIFVLTGDCPEIQSGGIRHVIVFSVTTPALWILIGDRQLKGAEKSFDFYRFWIYCSHFFPLECIEKLWLLAAGVSAGAALADFLFAPILTMLLLMLLGRAVRRLCPPLWGILNGSIPKKILEK